MKLLFLFTICICFWSAQARFTGKSKKDFDPRQLLFDYEDCLLMFQRKSRIGHGNKRYEYLESCITILEKIHGRIVALETIEKVLKSPLNPVDNNELFEKCVVEYSGGKSNVSANTFMENFVDKVQNLIDNGPKWVPHESLICYELDRAFRFMCDARAQCTKTDEEKKQLEFVYVVGYSLLQLVSGTNKPLSCSSFSSHEDGIWLGQLSNSVWSDLKLDMESQIFENDEFCPNLKFRRIYHHKISNKIDEPRQIDHHQTFVNLLAKI